MRDLGFCDVGGAGVCVLGAGISNIKMRASVISRALVILKALVFAMSKALIAGHNMCAFGGVR